MEGGLFIVGRRKDAIQLLKLITNKTNKEDKK
jgi:hypothetical protein